MFRDGGESHTLIFGVRMYLFVCRCDMLSFRIEGPGEHWLLLRAFTGPDLDNAAAEFDDQPDTTRRRPKPTAYDPALTPVEIYN